MHLSGNLVSFLIVKFLLNWSIIDEVTTRSTTPYFFGALCILVHQLTIYDDQTQHRKQSTTEGRVNSVISNSRLSSLMSALCVKNTYAIQ